MENNVFLLYRVSCLSHPGNGAIKGQPQMIAEFITLKTALDSSERR